MVLLEGLIQALNELLDPRLNGAEHLQSVLLLLVSCKIASCVNFMYLPGSCDHVAGDWYRSDAFFAKLLSFLSLQNALHIFHHSRHFASQIVQRRS